MVRDVVREVAAELHRLQGAHRELRRGTGGEGITLAAVAVLRSVQEHGPCVLARLADDAGLDVSVVSRHVSALVASGLVARTVDPGDARAHPVSVTTEGERVLAETGRALLRRWDGALAHWSDAELADLAATLRRLRADLGTTRDTTSTTDAIETRETVPA